MKTFEEEALMSRQKLKLNKVQINLFRQCNVLCTLASYNIEEDNTSFNSVSVIFVLGETNLQLAEDSLNGHLISKP